MVLKVIFAYFLKNHHLKMTWISKMYIMDFENIQIYSVLFQMFVEISCFCP